MPVKANIIGNRGKCAGKHGYYGKNENPFGQCRACYGFLRLLFPTALFPFNNQHIGNHTSADQHKTDKNRK